MMKEKGFVQLLFQKLNVKSGLLFLSLILMISGIYMCIKQFETTGSIDIKTVFITGKISSGSLGLLVIFLSIIVAIAAQRLTSVDKKVELSHGNLKIVASNLVEREWERIAKFIDEHQKQLAINNDIENEIINKPKDT